MHHPAVSNFSRAIVELAREEGLLEMVQSAALELKAKIELPEVRRFLSHPKVPVAAQKAFLQRLLSPETPVVFQNFLALIVDRRRAEYLSGILENIYTRCLEARGYEVVELISALPLTENVKREITTALSSAWESSVCLQYRENPNLIGGIVLRRGDRLYDGSLRGRLEGLRDWVTNEVLPGSGN